jgi:hypothetical protein
MSRADTTPAAANGLRDREICPRCGGRGLDPKTLICLCGTEFTERGLAYVRSLPPEQQRRTW